MADRIPQEILSEIRARVSIVEVISTYVALRRAGRSYLGLCPFHSENTPSFSVQEEGGFFHCFGCGVGGNVFTFLTRIEGISFPEAVRRLAQRAGVPLPHKADPHARERARLYRLNEMAATYFQRCLRGDVGKLARQYLAERGIRSDTAERFRLGFAPPWGGGLVRFLSEHKGDLDQAATLGLIGKRENGRYYDRFRCRLMFPITDVVGRVVGFGGRLLPAEAQEAEARGRTLPKYLNSPDSVLYKKGTLLYGLSHAKEAMQRRGRAVIVEGYIDLLALVQCGYEETVAVLGTALGGEQLQAVRRFAQEVYIFFDGDEAGRRAATRAFPLCVENTLRGRGVFLPHGYDPDTFARTYGQAKLAELIEERAEPLEDFYFSRLAPPPGATAFQRAQAAKEALAALTSMTDVVARGALFTQIAQRFGVGEEELRRVAAVPDGIRPHRAAQDPGESLSVSATAEIELIQLMLLDRTLALRAAADGVLSAFQHWQNLGAEIISAWRHSEHIDLGAFLPSLPKAVADRVARMYTGAAAEETRHEREQIFADCVAKLRNTRKKLGREQLLRAIREAERRGDEAELRRCLQRLREWDKEE
ncbi:MAG: DNA primase [Thermodesulfobacteriota bacterium]